jgi:hypothetical protein
VEGVARDRIYQRAVGEDIVGPARVIGETGADIESVPVVERHRRHGLERRQVGGAGGNAGHAQNRCNNSQKPFHDTPRYDRSGDNVPGRHQSLRPDQKQYASSGSSAIAIRQCPLCNVSIRVF